VEKFQQVVIGLYLNFSLNKFSERNKYMKSVQTQTSLSRKYLSPPFVRQYPYLSAFTEKSSYYVKLRVMPQTLNEELLIFGFRNLSLPLEPQIIDGSWVFSRNTFIRPRPDEHET
jgi:hypothetical protein